VEEGSWLGRSEPPEYLNRVDVDPPSGIFMDEEIHMIDTMFISLVGSGSDSEVAVLWTEALAITRTMYPGMF